MKKIFKGFLFAFLLLGAPISLSACHNDEKKTGVNTTTVQKTTEDYKDTWRVTFFTNGAGRFPHQYVLDGDKIVIPDEPKLDYLVFDGWYYNGVLWDFDNPVTQDMILEADWKCVNATYKVNHYLENVLDEGYTLNKTDILEGYSGGIVIPDVEEYPGYMTGKYEHDYILADGSTVLNVYYKRNRVKVIFTVDAHVLSDYTDLCVEYKIGSLVTLPVPKIEAGYKFNGWYIGDKKITESTYTVGDEIDTLVARAVPAGDKEYRVRYYFEDTIGDEYILDSSDLFFGRIGMLTDAVALEFDGLIAEPFTQNVINEDGSTVVDIYYKRTKSNVTIEKDSHIITDYSEINGEYKYGREIPLVKPKLEAGYVFDGWYINEEKLETSTYTVTNHDVEITLKSKPDSSTKYKVNHYLENIYDDGYTLSNSSFWQGVTDTLTNVVAPSNFGFIVEPFTQKIIAGDGSTVIDIYYKRIRSNVTIVVGSHILTDYSELNGAHKYGEEINLEEPKLEAGYIFDGWYNGLDRTSGHFYVSIEDITLVSKARASTSVEYVINYNYENISDDEYTLNYSTKGYGTTDTLTNAVAPSRLGFIAEPFTQKTIAGDGSTVVDIYYKRIKLNVTFEVDSYVTSSHSDLNGEYKYEYSIFLPTPTVEEGFIFDGWYVNGEKVLTKIYYVDNADVTLVAKAKADTVYPYTVNYYFENIYDDEYTLDSTLLLYGAEGLLTNIVAEEYTGFTAQPITQNNVEKDGSTVINVYYNRKTFTVKFNSAYNIIEDYSSLNGKYKYGYEFTLPTPTANPGYVFEGWFIDGVMFEENTYVVTMSVTLLAESNVDYHVPYKVNHYLENLLDSEYTLDLEETLYGQAFVSTNALALTYPGFIAEWITQKSIAADGTTIIDVYYKRVVSTLTISLTFNNAGSFTSIAGSYKYGTNINLPDVKAYLGYVFEGWYIGSEKQTSNITIGENDIELVAKFVLKDDVKYYILNSTLTTCEIIGVNDEFKDNTSFIIPNYVTSIKNSAFKNCQKIESITLPFIGKNAFGDSAFLGYIFGGTTTSNHDIYVPTTLKEVILTEGAKVYSSAFNSCTSITSITLPNTITTIEENAFRYATSLKTITLPNALTTIGASAFYNCTSLADITLPNALTNIGSGVFERCNALKEFTYNGTLSDWLKIELADEYSNPMNGATKAYFNNGSTKYDLKALSTLTIPSDITSIKSYALSGCNFTDLIIPENITNIEAYALKNIVLESITLPFIGESLNSTISKKLVYIFGGDTGYSYIPEALKNITITKETAVPNEAFYRCNYLENITFSKTITSIGNSAFEYCTALKNYTIASSITTIGDSAFTYAGLTSINIPSSITVLNDGVFENCSNLRSVTLPTSITKMNDDVFRGTTSLEITFNGTLADWCNIDFLSKYANPFGAASKVYFKNTDNTLYDFKTLTEIIIPSGVTSIGSYAFANCQKVTKVVVPDTVTTIKIGAFYEADQLRNITLPFVGEKYNGTTNTHFGYIFGAEAYENQYTRISIRTTVVNITKSTVIPSNAFNSCKYITSIILPTTLTTIGSNAFAGCDNLNIYYLGSTADSSKFNSVTNKIYYYAGSKPSKVGNYWHYDTDGITPVEW